MPLYYNLFSFIVLLFSLCFFSWDIHIYIYIYKVEIDKENITSSCILMALFFFYLKLVDRSKH